MFVLGSHIELDQLGKEATPLFHIDGFITTKLFSLLEEEEEDLFHAM